MKRLTQEQLEAIRERAEAATVGWIAADGIYVVTNGDDGNEHVIAECDNEINAFFIGEARQDVPKLLAEVERLQSELGMAQGEAILHEEQALVLSKQNKRLLKVESELRKECADSYELIARLNGIIGALNSTLNIIAERTTGEMRVAAMDGVQYVAREMEDIYGDE